MEICSVKDEDVVTKAVEVIRAGGIVVFPTDTAYGLGVDATSDDAVQKLYSLKERDKNKPIHVIVSGVSMAKRYVEVNELAKKIIREFLPGPLTVVLKTNGGVSQKIVGKGNTLGIRIPNNVFVEELSRRADVPITATSANKAGDENPYSIEDVKISFGSDFDRIDLIVDAGLLPRTLPSTLLDLTKTPPEILREGPVSREEILKVLL